MMDRKSPSKVSVQTDRTECDAQRKLFHRGNREKKPNKQERKKNVKAGILFLSLPSLGWVGGRKEGSEGRKGNGKGHGGWKRRDKRTKSAALLLCWVAHPHKAQRNNEARTRQKA